MRITNSVMQERLLRNLQEQGAQLLRASDQVATGLRNSRISDDPIAGAQVLASDAALRAVEQYRRSVTSVQSRQAAEESTLDQVGDLLSRAKELATAQGSNTGNAATRAAAAVEVQSLIDQAISLGNLRFGDEYLFGGMATDAPPFQANGSYIGTATGRQAEVGDGVLVDTVHSGQELLVDSGVLSSLTALRDALTANDPAAVRTSGGPLDTAFDATQVTLTEVGARTRNLELTTGSLTALQTALGAKRSAAAEIPLEEAMLNFASIQTAMAAAYEATSRILQTSLTEYL
jgi:flagellar hook-associated protein 3 FlgL